MMIWVDWIFVLAIVLSALTSFMRGALREIIALAAWICGAYVAFIYSAQSQVLLEKYVETPEFRYAIVFMTILIIFLILGAVLAILVNKLIAAIGLTSLDKSLGVIFGVARGLLLVVIFIMAASFTALPKNDWWGSSWLITKLQGPADQLLQWLENSGFWPEEVVSADGKLEIVPVKKVEPVRQQIAPAVPVENHVPAGTLVPVETPQSP